MRLKPPPSAPLPRATPPQALALALALCIAPAAQAQQDPSEEGMAAVQSRLDALSAQVAAQQQEIARLRGQLEQLELAQQRGRGLDEPAAGAQAAAQYAQQDAPQTPPAAAPAAPPPGTIGQAQQQDEAARREQEKALVVREHAPLFERRFTLDAGASYSYYDRRQLALSGFLALDAIFLGTINLDQTKASVYTLDVTGRYGLSDRLSVEANLPYVFRDSRFVSGGAGGASGSVSEVGLSSNGVGDVSLAGYYQMVKESARWPDVVASLRVRVPTGRDPFGIKLIQPDGNNTNLNVPEDLPTGTGLYAATVAVSALRTYDPVILFGNLGYTYHFARDFGDISPVLGQVQPARVRLGNPWLLSAGLAIALNDRSAVSFSVASSAAGATHTEAPGEDEVRVPGSSTNSTTFNVGGTYVLTSGWTINGQLAAGLTPDAPNFVMGVRASRAY